jgi:hypothetical protein
MMVNLVYFYDIISTMTTVTIYDSWTFRPDKKHEQDGELKEIEVSSVSIDLAPHQRVSSKCTLDITSDRINRLVVGRGCPIEFFTLLIRYMMRIPATIEKDYFGKFSVVIETFSHMKRHIDEAIQKMIDRSFFTDLSFDDAREIISRLNLKEFIYCFEGHESGVCLVVLGPNVRKQSSYEQPWYLFQQEVQKFNVSRTIFMTPEQEKRLVTGNEDFKKLVEFTSSFDKTTSRVVFKRENPSIRIIRQRLEVEKLTKQLSEAKRALEEMVELEAMLQLQKRMFPQ